MTEKELKYELEKDPFVPLRLHLVSGKTVDVPRTGIAWSLNSALLVFRNPRSKSSAEGYDVIAYHNIERIEQLEIGGKTQSRRKRA